jgi:hypothetical protein
MKKGAVMQVQKLPLVSFENDSGLSMVAVLFKKLYVDALYVENNKLVPSNNKWLLYLPNNVTCLFTRWHRFYWLSHLEDTEE